MEECEYYVNTKETFFLKIKYHECKVSCPYNKQKSASYAAGDQSITFCSAEKGLVKKIRNLPKIINLSRQRESAIIHHQIENQPRA